MLSSPIFRFTYNLIPEMEGDPRLEGVATADGEKPHLQNSSPDALLQETGPEEHQYVTGLKLAIIMSSLTITFFLAMLDVAIIATVSKHPLNCFCV